MLGRLEQLSAVLDAHPLAESAHERLQLTPRRRAWGSGRRLGPEATLALALRFVRRRRLLLRRRGRLASLVQRRAVFWGREASAGRSTLGSPLWPASHTRARRTRSTRRGAWLDKRLAPQHQLEHTRVCQRKAGRRLPIQEAGQELGAPGDLLRFRQGFGQVCCHGPSCVRCQRIFQRLVRLGAQDGPMPDDIRVHRRNKLHQLRGGRR